MENNILQEFAEKYHNDICIIILGAIKSVFILQDKSIIVRKILWKDIQDSFYDKQKYMKINSDIIINTRYVVNIHDKSKREILMKTGNILKVSRRNWTAFK